MGVVILGLLLPLPLPRFRFPQNAVILLVAIPPMNLEVADTANRFRFRFRFQNPAFDTSSLLISISSLKLSLPSFYFWRICSSVGPSVGPSIGPSVSPSVRHTLLFLGFCGFWPHCSCPNDGVTSIMAPAHPHATGVAVYPALFKFIFPYFFRSFLGKIIHCVFKIILSGKSYNCGFFCSFVVKQGRIHGYPSRVRVGRSSAGESHIGHPGRSRML